MLSIIMGRAYGSESGVFEAKTEQSPTTNLLTYDFI
jgi:hypothetical protein